MFARLFADVLPSVMGEESALRQESGSLTESRATYGVPSQAGARFGLEPDAMLTSAQLDHLASCVSCRLSIAEADPTLLFGLLSRERKDEAFFLGFETRVMARIRETDLKRRPLLGWMGARTVALAGGVALIAAAALLVMEIDPRPQAPSPGLVAQGPTGAVHDGMTVERTMPPSAHQGRPDELSPSVTLRLPELQAEAPAAVESIASTTAQIISIKVGEPEQGESDVVLIVDQGMDI